MSDRPDTAPIRKVIIVGGGTAGWMSAAAIAKLTQSRFCEIHLVESSAIGIVGVGEATIPPIRQINRLLEIDEDEFVRKTKATFKAAIQFCDWTTPGSAYFHAFGPLGFSPGLALVHRWRRLRAERGIDAGEYDDYSITAQAAHAGKFHRTFRATNMQRPVDYAFHFDAGLYAQFLREIAEKQGVVRHDAKIVGHQLRKDGFVEAILLEAGEKLEGDLFVDCSGFRALLIEGALGVGYEDWSHWLPCDRAVAMPSEPMPDLPPYTQATARDAGWQWRIPLQHRTGNGYVYCSRFIGDDEAAAELASNLPTAPAGDARLVKFRTGRRQKFWDKNVVTIGLSSGFLEPLESTSIHLIQTGIEKLLNLFPDRSFRQADIDFYNKVTAREFEQVRDLIVFHYAANGRHGQPLWDQCREMALPDSLVEKMELYRGYGRVFRTEDELFSPLSWTAVFEGQGHNAETFDPLMLGLPTDVIASHLPQIRSLIAAGVQAMPSHADFVRQIADAKRTTGPAQPPVGLSIS
ncbi:tryptophan halogenase family protein [Sphingomonas sp. URHD0057]|uniref:tryptophan halogenase family protein n=1 Tax=Sphingomonas sp. URHD0057 TaxID=1380389 RepID=UPI000688684B|nr:tryptophan halogenase family protein [Sphingomonas sp. URHD0057]